MTVLQWRHAVADRETQKNYAVVASAYLRRRDKAPCFAEPNFPDDHLIFREGPRFVGEEVLDPPKALGDVRVPGKRPGDSFVLIDHPRVDELGEF